MAKSRTRKTTSGAKRDNGLIAIGLVSVAVVVLIGALVAFNQASNRIDVSTVSVDYEVGITPDGQPFKGAADAPITVEEYADFRCPHCADFHTEFKEIEDEYVQTGQVRLVFRNYPVLGQASTVTAQATECALDQGAEAFWVYHDTLFDNSNIGETLYTRDGLRSVAEQAGLDINAFNNCFNANRKVAEVQQDLASGTNLGVTGTPTIFINGTRHNGARDAAGLRSVFDAMLEQ